jgi:hypothetical protein
VGSGQWAVGSKKKAEGRRALFSAFCFLPTAHCLLPTVLSFLPELFQFVEHSCVKRLITLA